MQANNCAYIHACVNAETEDTLEYKETLASLYGIYSMSAQHLQTSNSLVLQVGYARIQLGEY